MLHIFNSHQSSLILIINLKYITAPLQKQLFLSKDEGRDRVRLRVGLYLKPKISNQLVNPLAGKRWQVIQGPRPP